MLKDKVVFITGATRGIGRATAKLCAEHGATLILHGRQEDTLAELKVELVEQYRVTVYTVAYDVSDVSAVKKTFQWIKKELKQLDVLVNNAGVLDDALIGMIQHDSMSRTFAVNTEAVIEHLQYAARLMLQRQQGSIINISSIFGRVGSTGQVVYSASKAAVIGATYAASKELAAKNIRVNAVAPGFIETDMTSSLPPDKYNQRLSNIAMQRAGKPEEVAATILFLASDLSSYITGQVIGVDGGMVI